MIEGIAVRCNVGPVELLRSPGIELTYRRRAVVSRAVLEIPDPTGEVRAAVAVGQAVTVRFWYRGDSGLSHHWEGTVEALDQPGGQPGTKTAGADAVLIQAAGQEQKLATTMVTESFYGEPAQAVARRLLSRTGLPVAGVDIPADVLPHQVFSGVSVARAIKQLEVSLTRAFGHDLSKHAVWLGQNGLLWSADNEPGDTLVVESVNNLISHTPPVAEGGMGVVTAFLLPGLTASRTVRIHDARRGFDAEVRAQEVIHRLARSGNTTTIRYGKDQGWG